MDIQPNQTPINPMPGASQPPAQGFLKQMEEFFDTYLHKKAPFHLPPNVKEWIVKYSPWITLVVLVLAIPAVLFALGIFAITAPAMMAYGGYHYGPTFMLSGLFGLAVLIMEAVAIPGLMKRSLKSWHIIYYSMLVSAVGQLLGGSVIGMLIGLIIGLYFLFEIREYYK